MTTADWALIISLGSLAISLAGFVWNVWSKFIYPKPDLRISARVMHLYSHAGRREGPPFISLDMTNHGPGAITIHHAQVRCRRERFRKAEWGMINPIADLSAPDVGVGPFGGGLPKKIEVGESFALYFPYQRDTFLREPLVKLGCRDTFGRNHWVRPADLTKLLRKFSADFP